MIRQRFQRRRVLLVLAGAFAAPIVALAQQAGTVRRVGFLSSTNDKVHRGNLERLHARLRVLGYVEGKNISFDYRYANEKPERLTGLAAELAKSKPDLILCHGTPECRAVKAATSSIPIVMASVGDPLGAGLVASLARPGGNVTGLTNLDVGLAAKRLELLKEVLPKLSRIAVLRKVGNPSGELQYKDTQSAAHALGLGHKLYDVRDVGDLKGAFQAMRNDGTDALTVLTDPFFLSWRKQIADSAIANHLPTIFARNENVEAGGLISYGPSLVELYGQAASFIDKIFRGARPGELPIEQPAKFDLFINLKTAAALGVTIPKSAAV